MNYQLSKKQFTVKLSEYNLKGVGLTSRLELKKFPDSWYGLLPATLPLGGVWNIKDPKFYLIPQKDFSDFLIEL